jgi:peptidoglycan/xylan/chitin deacetylase (PgdA/CDA1 family)
LYRSQAKILEGARTQVFFTIDDFFLRNEWVSGIPTVTTSRIKPEEDFRILDVFEELHVNATLFISGIVAELFPETLEKLAKRGYEIAAHGYRHENFLLLNESEQRRRVEMSLKLLERHTNSRVVGWRSPGLHTDAGFQRMLKNTDILWCSNIEVPPFLKSVPFMFCDKVEMPISLIDLRFYERGLTPLNIRRKWLSSLDRQHGILTLIVHPWTQLCNMERLRMLRGFLEVALSRENVVFCRGSDIYRQFVAKGTSVYGTALSTTSTLRKRFSKWIQGPLSKTQKMI